MTCLAVVGWWCEGWNGGGIVWVSFYNAPDRISCLLLFQGIVPGIVLKRSPIVFPCFTYCSRSWGYRFETLPDRLFKETAQNQYFQSLFIYRERRMFFGRGQMENYIVREPRYVTKGT